jgi:hypothetical protein
MIKRPVAWIVAALLGVLFCLQTFVLEKTRVQKLERASMNLGELRASSLLPTYIGSLFLGSFRAVAIDVLWIQMHRMGEEEHRYFERVEIMDLITKLQPRNPEAWAYMGWDSAYNIANQFRTEDDLELLKRLRREPQANAERIRKIEAKVVEDDRQYRTWVRLGLLKLAEGCGHLPDDAYLKYEVGMALRTKSSWSRGHFDEQFLEAVENDAELQRILGGGASERPRTALELAERWFAKGKETLEQMIRDGRFRVFRTLAESMSRPPEEKRQHHTTQMGLNIDLGAFVGFIHEVRYLNGILKWRRARASKDPAQARALLLEAAASFGGAAEQAMVFRKHHSYVADDTARTLHDARAELCRDLERLCRDQAAGEIPAAALVSRIELAWWSATDRHAPPERQVKPVDDNYVLEYLSFLKQAMGGDSWEYNDHQHALHNDNLMFTGDRVDATIAPDSKDEDWYHFYVSPPRAHAEAGHDH